MLDDQHPEFDGSAQSPSLTPNQKMLLDVFGYFNKIAVSVAQEKIKIKTEKPNGMKTYLRKKEERESKGKILTSEECVALQEETMYDVRLIEAGNSTEVLRTLIRFVTTDDKFQKQMQECIGEAYVVANKKKNIDDFIKKSTSDDNKW